MLHSPEGCDQQGHEARTGPHARWRSKAPPHECVGMPRKRCGSQGRREKGLQADVAEVRRRMGGIYRDADQRAALSASK